MKQDECIREVYFSDEFWEFFNEQSPTVKRKFEYVLSIVQTIRVVNQNYVKYLEGEGLYEMRVSVGNNAYRTILFTIDRANLIEATKIVVLNAFLKKSTKDYKKQLVKAINILEKFRNDETE